MPQISPGEVVGRIWQVYRSQFPVLFGLGAILFAVQFVIFLLLSTSAAFPLAALFWALSVLYQGMVVKLVQDIQDGRRDHSVLELLRSVEPVFWQLLAVSLLFGLGVGIGFLFLIVPGLILMVLWAVVAPVTLLERPGIFAAFRRSRELVRGNGWNVFGVYVLVFVAVAIISILAGIASDSLGAVGRALVQWLVNSAVAPLTALSASVLYFALRGRPWQADGGGGGWEAGERARRAGLGPRHLAGRRGRGSREDLPALRGVSRLPSVEGPGTRPSQTNRRERPDRRRSRRRNFPARLRGGLTTNQ